MKKSRIKAVLFTTALGVCTFIASYAGAVVPGQFEICFTGPAVLNADGSESVAFNIAAVGQPCSNPSGHGGDRKTIDEMGAILEQAYFVRNGLGEFYAMTQGQGDSKLTSQTCSGTDWSILGGNGAYAVTSGVTRLTANAKGCLAVPANK